MAFTTHDNAPYLYRKSGGGGDKEIDKLVGGTIAWNQLLPITSSSKSGTYSDVVVTDNRDGSFTLDGTASANVLNCWLFGAYSGSATAVFTFILGHVYFCKDCWCNFATTNNTGTFNNVGTVYITEGGYFVKASSADFKSRAVRLADGRSGTTYNAKAYPQIIDLTQMFGSTIADYVYSLEQSSQGSGLAWLRSYGFFTEDYYDYNAGELKSVSNLVSHDMTGKNLVSKSSTNVGSITVSGLTFTFEDDGSVTLNGTLTKTVYPVLWSGDNRSVAQGAVWEADSKCRALPSGNYYWNAKRSGTCSRVPQMVLGVKTLGISSGTIHYANAPVTIDGETQALSHAYVGVIAGDVYSNYNIKWQLELGSTATSYEPYTLHSYPLGDVTLRGLPKLNGNALYYDGDTYESDGTVTRKYGVVDLGTLNWVLSGVRFYVYINASSPQIALPAQFANTQVGNIICKDYVATDRNTIESKDRVISLHGDSGARYITIVDSRYSTASDLKSALNGVNLVYELASSTTETADTYTNPQWVDPNGTEKYTLSANAFPMPVGHETTYNTGMGSKTVNTQVNLSMTEPQVRQVYAKEGDTARVLNIHLDQTEEDGTLRILRPDGTEVTADAVLAPDFYDGLMAEIPSDATEIVGKCYCDIEQNGVSSMPFTLNVKKNERES